ncbi:MAG: ABC transporter ATP-binding protein [Microthrixaceae bacterium]|nr:ABC transporter ATP-binding protein [Microthrixaceae bacterium]MCB1011266.1 ABC transporter ATP-binding protein [Microthrixaceae bacterium]MCB9387919.1 ABC transporter ATP-binding protein [Microthrixaceae bacterium]MCO5321832.1 ABC transporter ATP-binding protein [Microthrixaceae bacterium]
MSALEVSSMTVRFGGHQALSEVSLAVDQGKVVGLIGPNGAGKTTLFNAVCGVVTPTSGSVRLMGRDVSGIPTHKRARLGLGRTFQRLEVFASLSVADNVRAGIEIRRTWERRGSTARQYLASGEDLPTEAEVQVILDRLGLSELADVSVGALPTGQARLVELGRALGARPSVLLLDEPASGLDDNETADFGKLLIELAGAGLGILLVEHDVGLVMSVCEQIYVLDFGSVIASGDPDTVRSNEAVVAAYLGAGT